MATLKDSQKQEKKLAAAFGGTVNAGSGNGWIRKADVRTEQELWELKITSAKSYSLKDAELTKHNEQALVDGRIPIFLVEFKTTGNRWVIIPYDDYEALRERASVGNEAENRGTQMV